MASLPGMLRTPGPQAPPRARVRAEAGSPADQAIPAIYIAHYDPLARLATLLVGDVGTAEQIVQDSFVSLHGAWRRMRDRDPALSYLRHDVVNRSRSIPEHDMASAPHAVGGTPAVPAAGRPIAPLAAAAMIAALRALPPRQ